MSTQISLVEAQKIAIHSQKLLSSRDLGKGLSGALAAIQHLGYIQIDTISVVERAHHHTLWSRVESYRPAFLDQLQQERKIFEYWSHAAAYLPIEDFRFCLPRMQSIAAGERHWFEKDHKLVDQVLEKIKKEGPLQAKDFDNPRSKSGGWWEWKPAKKALEQLFMEGRLMVSRREKFQKVYDLTERVLPSDIDTRVPNEEEWAHHLVLCFLQAHGLGKIEEIGYQRGVLSLLRKVLPEMQEEGEVIEVQVGGNSYFALPSSLELLKKTLPRKKGKILSPFDNFVIQRKRGRELFDFDYQIECYTPEKKRKYGYFSLPLFWKGNFIGRMDAKASRADKLFIVRNLALEKSPEDVEEFVSSFSPVLKSFIDFNGCNDLAIEKVSDKKLLRPLKKAWQNF